MSTSSTESSFQFGAGLTGSLGADGPCCLAKTDNRSSRILDERHPGRVRHVERTGHNLASGLGDLACGRVDVVGGEVDIPASGLALLVRWSVPSPATLSPSIVAKV